MNSNIVNTCKSFFENPNNLWGDFLCVQQQTIKNKKTEIIMCRPSLESWSGRETIILQEMFFDIFPEQA